MAVDVRILIVSIKLWIVLVTAVQKAVVSQLAVQTELELDCSSYLSNFLGTWCLYINCCLCGLDLLKIEPT